RKPAPPSPHEHRRRPARRPLPADVFAQKLPLGSAPIDGAGAARRRPPRAKRRETKKAMPVKHSPFLKLIRKVERPRSAVLLVLDLAADLLRLGLQVLHRLAHARAGSLVALVVELVEVVFEAGDEISEFR